MSRRKIPGPPLSDDSINAIRCLKPDRLYQPAGVARHLFPPEIDKDAYNLLRRRLAKYIRYHAARPDGQLGRFPAWLGATWLSFIDEADLKRVPQVAPVTPGVLSLPRWAFVGFFFAASLLLSAFFLRSGPATRAASGEQAPGIPGSRDTPPLIVPQKPMPASGRQGLTASAENKKAFPSGRGGKTGQQPPPVGLYFVFQGGGKPAFHPSLVIPERLARRGGAGGGGPAVEIAFFDHYCAGGHCAGPCGDWVEP